ncbi:hypothetical protein ACFE04_001173 [Oxalis oulophora]
MFILRVHSVDNDHLITTEESTFTTVSSTTASSTANQLNPNTTTKYVERRGVVHLYRDSSRSSLPNCKSSSTRSTGLFVVAVPNYLSADDFIRFCNNHVDYVDQILFIRNDGTEDRYSVFIKFLDQSKADEFYANLNGRRFSPGEAEVCHILYVIHVEYTESSLIASMPPFGFTELPSCPICLERLDPDTSGILSTLCDHSFQCTCTSKWTHLSCQVCRFCQQQDEIPSCAVCGTVENLWVCLICGFVGCGRYKEGHAVNHWQDTQHRYSLELRSQQIWDYIGDNYVHRLNPKADGKSIEMNSRCVSNEGNCGPCECPEDSGISEALFTSRFEAIVDEYNRLLATQLEAQRQYYEKLISEARSKKDSSVSEAVERAVNSKMRDIQNQLEKYEEEKNTHLYTNRSLIKNQESLKNKVKAIEERESSSLRNKDETIQDLEEQIRDLTVFLEAQKTLASMTDDIKGGTLLPVIAQDSSPANAKQQANRKLVATCPKPSNRILAKIDLHIIKRCCSYGNLGGGDVLNQRRHGRHTSTQMGNGHFPSELRKGATRKS